MVNCLLFSNNDVYHICLLFAGFSSNASKLSSQDLLVLNSTNWRWFSDTLQTHHQSLHVQDSKTFHQTRLREQAIEVTTATRDYRSSSEVNILCLFFMQFCLIGEFVRFVIYRSSMYPLKEATLSEQIALNYCKYCLNWGERCVGTFSVNTHTVFHCFDEIKCFVLRISCISSSISWQYV